MTAPVASGWSELAGWGFHPLESAAFARRTSRADSGPILRGCRSTFRSGLSQPKPFESGLITRSQELPVIEVHALDRPGLLFDLARGLSDLGLDIAWAHIATFGEKAVDVFYVRDRFRKKQVSERSEAALASIVRPGTRSTAVASTAATGARLDSLARRSTLRRRS